ncbi:arsenical pump membrane protein [Campylobacter lari]|uniref:ArsB/NhaD family transporter n=1 Tax=Campylobacter lari TaxID=201 RepID=UPI0021535D79|nr:ArsB/NhaD family transporter [Campylobacter lari]MCR6530605.1 SLC13 family permease [Campylobacter lari]
MIFLIFLSTLILLFWRPFSLPIWVYSILGAVICLVVNKVNMQDMIFVFNIIWDSSLTLIGLILISLVLERSGFFDYVSIKILQFSKTKRNNISLKKLLFYLLIFTSIVTSFLGNDGAILVVTPIVVAIISKFKFDKKNDKYKCIYLLLFIGFCCDFLSNTLIVSNLTNIITAEYFHISFFNFFKNMLIPSILVFIVFAWVCNVLAKKILPKNAYFLTANNSCSKNIFILNLIYLFVFAIGLLFIDKVNIPMGVFTLFAAFILMMLNYKKNIDVKILKKAPWGILIFSFGLYVVVYGIYKEIDNEFVLQWIQFWSNYDFAGLLVLGFTSAIFSSIFNNLPTIMIGNLVLNDYFNNFFCYKELIYIHILGCNIGSKLTPIGSLSTLLWFGILLKYNIKIKLKDYFLYAFIFSIFVLFFAILGIKINMHLF